eukprot:scaffold7836_cov131-Cylindrotheca_fusiformis.AAC.1
MILFSCLTFLLVATAGANSDGSWVRLELNSGLSSIDQVRILTKPRAGYSAQNDAIQIFKKDGGCLDESSLLVGVEVPFETWEC